MLSSQLMNFFSLLIVIIIANVFFTLWYVRYRKRVVKCRILKEYGDSWEIVKEKKIKLDKRTFEHDNKSYNLDPQKILFTNRKGLELYFKEDESEPITFVGSKKPKDSKVFAKVLKSEVVSKLITGYKDKYYMLVILCLIVVVLGVSVYALYTFNNMNRDLIALNELLINQTKSSGVIIG